MDAHRAGDGDRECADRVRLVNDNQYSTMAFQPGEQFLELGLVLGQGFVEDPAAGSIECAGVVGLLAHVQPAPDVETGVLVHDDHYPSIERDGRHGW